MDRKPNELELAQASHWYVRLRAADCSLAERCAFQAWLLQHSGHQRAYGLAKLAAERVDRLASADARLRDLAAQVPVQVVRARPRSRARWRAAAALVLGVGFAGALALIPGQGSPGGDAVASYTNSGMQRQVIELPDGSRVHLDIGATVKVRMARTERRLELRSGRAYFEVAHDTSRPFSVRAGGSRTMALGTRFEIALAAQGVKVTLAEGSVEVTPVADAQRWREVLRPGQQLQLDSAGDRSTREVDALSAIGWAQGRLVFKGTPLADALDEINRYAQVKLQLGDSSLETLPIGGSFLAGGDTEQVVAALSAMVPLRAVHVGASDIVLFRRYEAGD